MDSDNSQNGDDLDEVQVFNAIKNILIKRNDLNRMRAELRSNIVRILHEQEPIVDQLPNFDGVVEKKKAQNFIIAMMAEYLDWCGYKYASDILSLESGTPKELYGQENWRRLFQFNKSEGSMPLLAEMAIKVLTDNEKEVCKI